MRPQGIFRRRLMLFALGTAAGTALVFASCSDNQSPEPAPSRISIVSGADQYSKKGTELENPVVVKVAMEDGGSGEGVVVNFQVIDGGGTLSRSSAAANGSGNASVRWTLGPDTTPQRIRASVASNGALNVQISATSSDYYCPEEDPTFSRQFFPRGDLFLLTRQSSLNRSGNTPRVGLVQIAPVYPDSLLGFSFVAFDEDALLNVVRDCAFSANGDFFIAWAQGAGEQEIIKIESNGSASHFATLASFYGSEIALLPGGVLGGCDEFGPFTVGCRDTLTRYEDAAYSGDAADAANNDAVAVDPVGGDLYFIYLADRSLYRLPLDGYTQVGNTEKVVTLEIDEAWGAKGMVVDDNDGSVYILVESTNTKSIVKVTPAGVKSTAVDFFARRGAGDLAGIQSDLAIDQGIRQLFTVDTLNNVIVFYQIATDVLDTLAPQGDPGTVSDGSQGERVGLAVMP